MGMVYGGGAVGLMGACADAALQGHSEVVGVLPRALARSEVAHPKLTELRIVEDAARPQGRHGVALRRIRRAARRLRNARRAVRGRHLAPARAPRQPIGSANVDGYFAPLLRFLQDATAAGFVGPALLDGAAGALLPDELLSALFG